MKIFLKPMKPTGICAEIALLLILASSAYAISIHNKNWTLGDNMVNISFDTPPNRISFSYPDYFIYKSISEVNNLSYLADFYIVNDTPTDKYTLIVITEQSNKSFTLNFSKMQAFINSTPSMANETAKPKQYPFGLNRLEFSFVILIFFLVLIIITVIVAQMERIRKISKKG